MRDAASWASQREGTISWAVFTSNGVLHSRNGARRYPSASTSKAMLLAAYLRRHAREPIPPAAKPVLETMIRRSGNRAAHAIHAQVGDAGLTAVARAAGMRGFQANGTWSEAAITAADQARLFFRLDRVLPPRHRAYGRTLLGTIVPQQRWGIPRPLLRAGFTVLFKGGWRKKLVHQAALVERDGERAALAVLTDANPSHEYGRATLEGIAKRMFARPTVRTDG